jgi:HK97 family phage major capsid protein
MNAYGTFLRRGTNALRADELKLLRVSDNVQAGYLCPPQVADEIIEGVTAYSPIRKTAKLWQCRREAIEIPKKTGSGAATPG